MQSCECRSFRRHNAPDRLGRTTEYASVQNSRLAQAVQEHSCTLVQAQPAASSLMPTRLLGLKYRDGIDDLRSDVSLANAPYVTLSYCWGSDDCMKSPQLTMGTLYEMTESIPITSLPRIFQDTVVVVVVVVRELGVRYLWIDSLCIIQDSESDWQRESSRMTEIYRNSVANIAAEEAANCHAGLFVRREGKHTRGYILDGLRIADSPSQDYLLVPVAYRDKIEDGPLRKRGWAFQERLLAPRQISFGSHQVFRRCSRFTPCEFFPSGYPTDLWTREHIDSDLFQCLEGDHSMKNASGGL